MAKKAVRLVTAWAASAAVLLVLVQLPLTCANIFADFVSTSDTKILDGSGQELFFSGINLGNWLVWEGYLMMGDFNYRTHTQFFNELSDALGGPVEAAEFEYQWRLNYVDEQAIADLSDLGFNSVRVPFNYKLFYTDGQIVDDGFEFFDHVIDWCRTYGMYVLLDMHGAPGYQNPGDHSDNVDSNSNQPRDTVKFWDGNNVQIAASIWRHIASRYSNEPVVWGYDLINEPVPQAGREYELLPSYVAMRNAIREVDNNHIIVAEGSWWGSDLTKIDWKDSQTQKQTGITSQWDDKLVYQIHHYGPASATYGREQITNNLNIPLFIGEYGETDEANLRAITDWAKQTLEGYYPWSFKKMSHDRTLWTIPPDDAYNQVKNYINNGGTPPTHLYDEMISFAQTNIRNGHSSHQWHQGFYDAIKPSITCNEASSFVVPGQIEAEEYCEQQGVQVETTTDSGGGQNIGFLDAGDYTEYNIDIGSSGLYTFSARVASEYSSGRLDVQIDGTSLAVLSIPNTYGWQSFTTISTILSLAQGTHQLRLAFPDGGFNINWVSFSVSSGTTPTTSPTDVPQTGCTAAASFDVPGKIEAELFCDEYGVQLESTSDVGGGQNIGFLDAGDYTEYNISVGSSGPYTFAARVASDWSSGQMDVKVDGTLLASFSIPNTGGWQSFITQSTTLSLDAGNHRLRLEFPGGGFNLNWMTFSVASTTNTPTKSPTSTMAPSNTPTNSPAALPTPSPVPTPTISPTMAPSNAPITTSPTVLPTPSPVQTPTKSPTSKPTISPVGVPLDCDSAPSFAVPGYLQAEQYCNHQGVELETTSDDGGGQKIVQLDNKDYVEYNIQVGATGHHTFAARVQSQVYSGQINLQLDGVSILWLSVPHTNGGWQTIWANVWLTLGTYRLRVAFPQGGFEVNWMAFAEGTNNPPLSIAPSPTTTTTFAPTESPGTVPDTASPTTWPSIGPTSAPSTLAPTTSPPASTAAPTRNPATASPTTWPTMEPTTDAPTPMPSPTTLAPTMSNSNDPPADCSSAPGFAVPGVFEAEQYCNQQGIELETTSDISGSQNIANLDNGDFAEYNLDIGAAGQYTFAARVQSPIYSGQINLQLDGVSVLWLSVPHTNGGWQTIWANVWLTAGSQRLLRVAFPQGGFKINRMAFSSGVNNPATL